MARLLFCFNFTKNIFCGGGTGTKWWSDNARLGLGTACNAVSSCSGLFVWMCGYKVETLLVLLLDLHVAVNQLSQLRIYILYMYVLLHYYNLIITYYIHYYYILYTLLLHILYILYSIGCGVQEWDDCMLNSRPHSVTYTFIL